MEKDEIDFIVNSILSKCNFVERWDQLPDDAVRIVSKKEAKDELIKSHIEKIKNDNSIEKHISFSQDEYQEGDKWKPLRNEYLSNQLSRKIYEPQELVLHENMLVCMTHNKVVNNRKVLYSQGSLAIINGFSREEEAENELVNVTLLPPGVRFFEEVPNHWEKATIRIRKSNPTTVGRGYKVRRIQYPFCYSNCFTMHKIIGQTLMKVAVRLSTEEKYRMWERELLTVAISRVHNLSSNYIVGSKEEAKKALLVLLEMKNPLIDEITKRLQMLNVLSSNHDRIERNSITDKKMLFSMIDITYTPPIYGFIYLLISRRNPFKTYLGETSKRLEKQLREDNNGISNTYLCNEIWEIYSFIYGFDSEKARLSSYSYLKTRCDSRTSEDEWNAPWLMNQRIK